jgi:hypothetical protein
MRLDLKSAALCKITKIIAVSQLKQKPLNEGLALAYPPKRPPKKSVQLMFDCFWVGASWLNAFMIASG